MRPLTLTRPKHLLPIANRPHIHHVFDGLIRHGVTDVVLTTSYLAEAFEATVAEAGARGIRLEVAHEPEARGTAGAIKNAQAALGDERFLVLNADVLTAADLTSLVAFHDGTGAEGTVLLTAVEDPSAFGVVPTEGNGRVTGFIEKPPRDEAPTNLINAGVYVMEPRVLDRIPAGQEWSAERALFPEMVEAGALFASASEAYWMDIGTPAKYLQANVDALEGRFVTDAVTHPGHGASLVDRSAKVAQGAEVSSSCIGAACVVASGASIERSVLLAGARVGERAIVRDSVVGERASVGSGTEVVDLAIGDDEEG
ncbi:MAG: mannose-phosphate guanylyltransferase [Actinomycetota bacterium]|nr:mannose-phosphate guanylyltransferase [Actinomycetota bacterium]